MTRPRDSVLRHYAKVRAGLVIVGAFSLVPSVVACDPAPRPALVPSIEPPSATMASDTEIEARIYPPKGPDWRLGEVAVKNAKLLSRDGESPLVLRMVRSQPGVGETTVLGADEPIEITVTWESRAAKDTTTTIFKLMTSANAKQGESVPVSAE